MSATLIISIIATLILISVIVSAVSYNRQQSMARRKNKLSQCLKQADEATMCVQTLLRIDREFELILLLQEQVVTALKTALTQAPNNPTLQQKLSQQIALLANYQEGKRTNKFENYCTNDSQLRQAHVQLTQIAKIIDLGQNQNRIAKATAQALKAHLQHLKLALDVNSHLHQANRFVEKNDIVMYQTHIKQARENLKKSGLAPDIKNKHIEKLSELLNEAKSTHTMSKVKLEL